MRQLEHFPNLVAMFFARAAEKGDAPFLWAKRQGAWQFLSWRETARQATALAQALRNMGLKRGDRVILVSENRPEWCIADLAIMAAGCVTVPAYTTNMVRDHQHIFDDSGARAAIVSTAKLIKNMLPAALRCPACEHIITIEPVRTVRQAGSMHFYRWETLVGALEADVAACTAAVASDLSRDDLACIIYTSGTGGAPRGVMQHHGAILHNVAGCVKLIAEDFGWGNEIFLSLLPLSHAYEHSGGQFFPIGLGAQIYYAEGLEKLASNIAEARPTIMIVVPRLFELLRQRITQTVAKKGWLSRTLIARALAIGKRRSRGKTSFGDWPMNWVLDGTLRRQIARRLGGRIKAMVSGGAPLNPDTGIFFQSLGLTLLQGYGQTEAGPVISCNRPKAGIAMNSVGPPLEGVEVRIASDGEILVRGELVMKGYWRQEALSAQTLADGWLHTGDIGRIDDSGRLVITDRKKDIIVLDKGDTISPQKIEAMLILQPEIMQAMVIGDKRPHLVSLIVPDAEWTAKWCILNQRDCNFTRLRADPDYINALATAIERVNADLSAIEKVRRFLIARQPFTIENRQLTPSLKVRRHILMEMYGKELDLLYRH